MADALSVPGEVDDELRWIARAVYATNAVTSGTAPEVEGEQPFDLKDIAERIVTVDLDVHPMIGLLKSVVAFFSGDRELTMRCLEEGLHAGSAWSRAAVRMLRASFAENDGDVEAMRRDADQALREFRALGERWGTASTLRAIGQLRTLDGDLAGAFAAYEEALALMREVGSREDEGFLLLALADLLLRQGHGDEARAYVTEAQHSAELTGSRIETVFALMVLADLERHAGNLDRARQLQRELAQWQETMPQVHPAHGHAAAIVSAAAAELALADGDRQAVPAHAREAYRAGVASKDLPLLANVGVTLADIAVEVDLPATAAEMLGAAARIRGADDRTALSVSRLRATLCERLGESEFQRAYDHGRALDRLAAIDCLDPDRWIDRVTE
jgi:ATP/maltotriose-dependent transcriptional regulator MalT